jgi:hypothetical protein
MPNLTVTADVDAVMAAANNAAIRTLLGLGTAALAATGDFDAAGAAAAAQAASQPLDADLTSWAAITRASGVDTFITTPSGANLANLLTTALPATKGGTGLTTLGTGVATALSNATGGTGGLVTFSGNIGAATATSLSTIGSSNTPLDLLTLRNTSATTASQTRINFQNDIAPSGDVTGGRIFYTGAVYSGFPASTFGFWNTITGGHIAMGTSGTERFRIWSGGGVSINNTVDPGAGNLSVTGSGAFSTTLAVTGASTFTGLTTHNGGIAGVPQALSGAGAVDVVTLTTALTTTGASQALTLANGTNGQIKYIIHDVDGGSAILTPTTKTGFSTVTFTNAGDTVTLVYLNTRGWFVLSVYGATVTP